MTLSITFDFCFVSVFFFSLRHIYVFKGYLAPEKKHGSMNMVSWKLEQVSRVLCIGPASAHCLMQTNLAQMFTLVVV